MTEKQTLIRNLDEATPVFQKIAENEKFAAKYPGKRAFDKFLTFLMIIPAGFSILFWTAAIDVIADGGIGDLPLIAVLLIIFLDLPLIVCIIGLARAKKKYKAVLAETEELLKSPELEWLPVKYRDLRSFDIISDAVYSGKAQNLEEACEFLARCKNPDLYRDYVYDHDPDAPEAMDDVPEIPEE